jgi:hypothetical protein
LYAITRDSSIIQNSLNETIGKKRFSRSFSMIAAGSTFVRIGPNSRSIRDRRMNIHAYGMCFGGKVHLGDDNSGSINSGRLSKKLLERGESPDHFPYTRRVLRPCEWARIRYRLTIAE